MLTLCTFDPTSGILVRACTTPPYRMPPLALIPFEGDWYPEESFSEPII
jgi:hypothetical protein